MEAKWLQNGSLEASGRPLGADPASRGSPEPSWRGSGAAGGSEQVPWALPGALRRRQVDRFQGPGVSPGGPRRLPGRLRDDILGGFLEVCPGSLKFRGF